MIQDKNEINFDNKNDVFYYWRDNELANIEFLSASYKYHSYPRHFHDTYVIQIIESGVNQFYCNNEIHTATAGSVIIINPSEVHTGSCVGDANLKYRAIYPTIEFMSELVQNLSDSGGNVPLFHRNIYHAPDLYTQLLQIHKIAEKSESNLHVQATISDCLSEVIKRYAAHNHYKKKNYDHIAVKIACDYINSNFNDKISLKALSDITQLSPFHFLRSFKKYMKMTPFEYLLNVRIERAKMQLKQKFQLSQIALDNGFYDQSHFIRNFKKYLGMSPGKYLNNIL